MTTSRRAGVLMPIFSLPGQWGIGCFSTHARRFVDQLAAANQSIWQILPLGPTGYGDSPYQSFSTYAGNPNFIDLDQLVAEGLLTQQELVEIMPACDPSQIDYGPLISARQRALRLAQQRAGAFQKNPGYQEFANKCGHWLTDYALFMAIKGSQRDQSWTSWPEPLRHRDPEVLDDFCRRNASEIDFYCWTQWQFFRQWDELHAAANAAGISILGDIPIYVAMDSADTWAHPELFQLDADLVPTEIAGVPPDGFSDTGQLWGNPLYDWPVHQNDGYAWWVARLTHQFTLYDQLRLDHFRGLESYFAVPAGDPDARRGRWRPGPGLDFFTAIADQLGKLPMIAEDLGYLTADVLRLRDEAGLPGMQLIQFAFDSREVSDYWPHNFVRDCVVYTGTHDNNTLQGWFTTLSDADQQRARSYLNSWWTPASELHWDFITEALRSVGDTCIIPMADYLGLGAQARINTPALAAGNWRWRMGPEEFSDDLITRIADLTALVERA